MEVKQVTIRELGMQAKTVVQTYVGMVDKLVCIVDSLMAVNAKEEDRKQFEKVRSGIFDSGRTLVGIFATYQVKCEAAILSLGGVVE